MFVLVFNTDIPSLKGHSALSNDQFEGPSHKCWFPGATLENKLDYFYADYINIRCNENHNLLRILTS